MESIVAQIILPLVLALIMFGMGLGLALDDFRRVITQPGASILGLGLQVLFLPIFALLISTLLALPPAAAAGLFLVSLCPGGATSNLFSYFARGDVALSVTLTGVVSLISPLTLPLAFTAYLQFTGSHWENFSLPLLLAIKQLIVVTLLPMITGMLIRHLYPLWSGRLEKGIKKASLVAIISIIIALMITNPDVVLGIFSLHSFSVLLLATGALLFAYKIARKCKFPADVQHSIAIEVGVQNAGTAMMVALSIMHKPELAVIPLTYGLLMNIPALAFILWVRKKGAQINS